MGWEVSIQLHGCLAAVWEGPATFGQAAAPLKSPRSQHLVGYTRKELEGRSISSHLSTVLPMALDRNNAKELLLRNTALAHHLCQGAQHDSQRSCASSGRQVGPHHKGTLTPQQPQERTGCQYSCELPHDLNNKASCITYNFLLSR